MSRSMLNFWFYILVLISVLMAVEGDLRPRKGTAQRIKDLEAKVCELKEENKKLSNKIKNLEKAQRDLHYKKKNYEKGKHQLKSKVKSLEKEKAKLKAKVKKVEKEKDKLNTKVKSLEKEKGKRKDELSAKVECLEKEKNELNNKVQNLIREIGELNTKIKNLEKEKQELNNCKKRNEDVSNQNEQLAITNGGNTNNPARWNQNFECIQNCNNEISLPGSCEEAMPTVNHRDGAYLLKLKNTDLKPFYVYCKRRNTKIWTVIQRRQDGSVDFNRDWSNYTQGFGNLYGEYWLGLKRIHIMTTIKPHKLYVSMANQQNVRAFAVYDYFKVASEDKNYKLTVAGYKGNAGDSFDYHNGQPFSTRDRCNDYYCKYKTQCTRGCPQFFLGGWWFYKCYEACLNGRYLSNKTYGVDYDTFAKRLRFAEMSITQV